MPISATKVNILNALTSGGANRLLLSDLGDFSNLLLGTSVAPWVSAIGDLSGDGIGEIIIGAGGYDGAALLTDIGRIVVHYGQSTGGSTAIAGGSRSRGY